MRTPRYDFQTGRGELGERCSLPRETIIIVEGIHGLNPRWCPASPPEWIYRIYVSALTQLNIDHHNRVPTTDTRLLRRIVRDAQYRGYSAQETIERWESVRRGEERNIFPYQENADVMFNSALAYELAVLKPLAEPLLLARAAGHDGLHRGAAAAGLFALGAPLSGRPGAEQLVAARIRGRLDAERLQFLATLAYGAVRESPYNLKIPAYDQSRQHF